MKTINELEREFYDEIKRGHEEIIQLKYKIFLQSNPPRYKIARVNEEYTQFMVNKYVKNEDKNGV